MQWAASAWRSFSAMLTDYATVHARMERMIDESDRRDRLAVAETDLLVRVVQRRDIPRAQGNPARLALLQEKVRLLEYRIQQCTRRELHYIAMRNENDERLRCAKERKTFSKLASGMKNYLHEATATKTVAEAREMVIDSKALRASNDEVSAALDTLSPLYAVASAGPSTLPASGPPGTGGSTVEDIEQTDDVLASLRKELDEFIYSEEPDAK